MDKLLILCGVSVLLTISQGATLTSNQCPKEDNPAQTVHIQHETDCSRFYTCNQGEKVLTSCPAGLQFNTKAQVCDWPDNVQCHQDEISDESREQEEKEKEEEQTHKYSEESDEGEEEDEECPPNDDIEQVVQLPHETNCELFYKCSQGKKVVQRCPNGLLYNTKSKVCDWAVNVNCRSQPTKPDYDYYDDMSENSEQNLNEEDCPPDTDHVVQLPHETDCELFYKCSHGQKVVQTCPKGLLYNKQAEVCDWPENVNCAARICPKTYDIKHEVRRAAHSDPDCPATTSDSETIHLPHETNCSEYYKCDNGVKQLLSCPGILLFNPELKVCDWPGNVACHVATTTVKVVPQLRCPQTQCQDSTIYLVSLASSREFIRCENGKEVVGYCPNGLVFDTKLKVCNLEHLAE